VLVDPDLRRDRDADEERLQVVLLATPAVAADTVEGWVRHLDVPGARVRVLADTDLAARLRFRIPSSLADVVTDPLVQRESLARASVAVLTSSELWTEAAYLGVPALIVSEDPQVQEDGAAFARLGAAVTLRHVDSARVANATRDLLENMLMRRAMARAGRRLVDGRGLLRIVGSLLPGVSNTVVQA
jgi:hypothetical protein